MIGDGHYWLKTLVQHPTLNGLGAEREADEIHLYRSESVLFPMLAAMRSSRRRLSTVTAFNDAFFWTFSLYLKYLTEKFIVFSAAFKLLRFF